MARWQPKNYFDNGRTIAHDADLSTEDLAALDAGEILTLLDERGLPSRRLLKDSYGTLRAGPLACENKIVSHILRLPSSPFRET